MGEEEVVVPSLPVVTALGVGAAVETAVALAVVVPVAVAVAVPCGECGEAVVSDGAPSGDRTLDE